MIEFIDVRYVHQGGFVALNSINLRIEKSETVAIVGENGAGKTTLVKHINGLFKPTSGSVLVDGLSTRDVSTAQLSRKVGISFQNPDHQLFSESVEREVAFGMQNFGFGEELVKQRTDWALGFFGLEQYRNSSPLTLSGGEKKRLALASVLAWDPDVVILDEPTVGQDAIQKEKLAEIINMLRWTGKTMIVVSHDMEFIWPIQPRLIVMAGGLILADGPIGSVMRDGQLVERARIAQPNLLSVYEKLTVKPSVPFVDVNDARNWIARRMGD